MSDSIRAVAPPGGDLFTLREAALAFLACLHPGLTVDDDKPMEMAQAIFDQVLAERMDLAKQVASARDSVRILNDMLHDSALRKALEFAEYMAKGAEQLLDALQAWHEAKSAAEDQSVDALDAVDRATEVYGERLRGLRSDIYEFRKRATRASDRYPEGGDRNGLRGAAIERGPKDAPKTCKNRSEDAPPSEP